MRRSQRALTTTGFTIIETLIVLAIAGLILLIVFEAIPALTRSGRNNQRRQDVNLILEAVSSYELSNSGNFPVTCGGAIDCTQPFGSTPNDYFLRFRASKLAYYITTNVFLTSQAASSAAPIAGPGNVDIVNVYNYEKCDTNTQGNATTQGAGFNDVVALYAVETGGGAAAQCQQL